MLWPNVQELRRVEQMRLVAWWDYDYDVDGDDNGDGYGDDDGLVVHE